jgi:antitoxin (DNA-binding transcriptional repressor) of toxin-antitoxin stability system
MGTLRITEAELARDIHAVLAKVRTGVEVIVEQDHRPVATIRPPTRSGRPISACIASAKASGSKVTLDGGFGKDVEEGIRERSQRRTVSECLALAEAHEKEAGQAPVLDPDLAADVEEIVRNRKPSSPSARD